MSIEIHPELKNIATSMKNLRDAGIIRSKNLVGDLGEYYCKVIFNIQTNTNPVTPSYDGLDEMKNRVEIKTRRTPSNSAKVIFRGFDFDYCLYVELDEGYSPVHIYKITVQDIIRNLDRKGDRLSVGKLRKINPTRVYSST